MATGSRTLKLSILGDVSDLNKSLKSASTDVETFGSKAADFGKKAGLAFAIAGAAVAAYAGKLLVDGVQAAIADEAAQAKLATTLKNVTGATDAQVKSVEDYIYKTQIANGITDEVLRPSLERLLRATSDITQAQKLQSLALDIAAGSGKSLEAVSNALGKAYEGSSTSLAKLGVGLSAAELKTMSFDEVTKQLSETFGGQAAEQADTFQGKMARLSEVFAEAKETVGSFILDAITPLVTLFVENVVPIINELATSIGEKLSPVFANLAIFFTEVLVPAFQAWWGFITEIVIPGIVGFFEPVIQGISKAFGKVAKTIVDNKEKLQPLYDLFISIYSFASKYLAPFIGEVLGAAFQVLGVAISGIISLFARFVQLITDAVNAVKALASALANSVVGKAVTTIASGIGSVFGGGRASGGDVTGGTSYLVGERGAEIFTPKGSGSISPNASLGGNVIYNINVTGAIDQESVARQIVTILNNSTARGTQGAANLSYVSGF